MPLDTTGYLTDNDRLVDALEQGKSYLLRYGWCQRQSMDGYRKCALSALGNNWNQDTVFQLQAALNQKLGGSFMSVPYWQDKPERKLEDVIELYDQAIRNLKGSG